MAEVVLTEPQRKRLDQLAAASKAVEREIRKLQGELGSAGIRFPSALPVLLDSLNNTVDSIFVILNTPHIEADASHQG